MAGIFQEQLLLLQLGDELGSAHLDRMVPGLREGSERERLEDWHVWVLRLDKSKFSPGPPPKTQTLNFEGAGQDLKNTAETTDAQDQATKVVFMHIYDGKPHPTTGNPIFDATTHTPVDAYHVNWVRSIAGKAVQTGSNAVSSDGRAFAVTTEGTGANSEKISSVAVYETQ